MPGREKDDLDFEEAFVDGENTMTTSLWNGDHHIFPFALGAFWGRGDSDTITITKAQYDELDSCGLTYEGFAEYLADKQKEHNERSFDILESFYDDDDYESEREKIQEIVDEELYGTVQNILSESSINSPMLVAAGVMFGLPGQYIADNDLRYFFQFYCDMNYDLRYPHFKPAVLIVAYNEREKWVPRFPYLQAGFTDVDVIDHAVANDIDPELLRAVD